MSGLEWPVWLSTEIFSSLLDTVDDGLERTEMASGWVMERRQYAHAPARRQVQLLMESAAEANVLIVFANEAMGQSFTMQCEAPGFYGAVSTLTCRFLAFPKPRQVGKTEWVATLDLMIERLDLPQLKDLPAPGTEHFGAEGGAFADLLETVINVTLPAAMGVE